MKKIVLLCGCLTVLAMTAFVGGCKKDKDKDTTAFTITATVENGSTYNATVKRVLAYAYTYNSETGEEKLLPFFGNYVNGGFTLSFPNPLNSEWLNPISDYFSSYAIISDTTAKIQIVDDFLAISSPSGDWGNGDFYAWRGDNRVGWFIYVKDNGHDDWADALVVYVDKDVTLTGSREGEGQDGKWKDIFNVSLKKGWNWVYETGSVINEVYVYESTTQAVSGLKWYFDEEGHKKSSKFGNRK